MPFLVLLVCDIVVVSDHSISYMFEMWEENYLSK